jgi:hypothetical protein
MAKLSFIYPYYSPEINPLNSAIFGVFPVIAPSFINGRRLGANSTVA